METDEIDDAIRDLQRDRDQGREDLRRLQQRFDELANKLRYPGTRFLVDLEYKLVAENTLQVAGTSVVTDGVFESLPGTLHAVYALSAYCPDSDTPILVTDGTVVVAPANAISVCVQRQRQSSPTRIEASVLIDNTAATARNVAYRVWRRLGMGS